MPTPNSFASAGYMAVDTDRTIYFGGSNNNLIARKSTSWYRARAAHLADHYSPDGGARLNADCPRQSTIDALTSGRSSW